MSIDYHLQCNSCCESVIIGKYGFIECFGAARNVCFFIEKHRQCMDLQIWNDDFRAPYVQIIAPDDWKKWLK
jgi:hypothetical protein